MATEFPEKGKSKSNKSGVNLEHHSDNGIHRTQDSSNRFPSDQLLRSRGFRLLARPDNQPAIWEKNGIKFTEMEALDKCNALKKKPESIYDIYCSTFEE